MVSNRLPPIVRTFFRAQAPAAAYTQRDPQGQGEGYSQAERDATEEEARRALEALQSSEEFQKNELRAELSFAAGYALIVVKNSEGTPLRSLRGREILRLLEAPAPGTAVRSGRLFDQRF